MKLRDICLIQSGLVTSRKDVNKTNLPLIKQYKLLTLKCLNETGDLNHNFIESFDSCEVLDNKYLTKKNDIIVGSPFPFHSITIKDNEEGILIPTNLIIIRLKDHKKFKPEYISIFLNSDLAKDKFLEELRNFTSPSIKKSNLENLEVKSLDLDSQINLIGLYKLHKEEKKLLSQLLVEKDFLNKNTVNKILK